MITITNMKYLIPLSFFVLTLAFSFTNAKQHYITRRAVSDSIPVSNKASKKNKKEPIYDLPENITSDTALASFLKSFGKGKIIYTETCAKCHDSTRNGKKFYPDFSLPQLLDYEMRFQYPEHGEDLKETNITAAELDDVVLFLQYKKRNLPK